MIFYLLYENDFKVHNYNQSYKNAIYFFLSPKLYFQNIQLDHFQNNQQKPFPDLFCLIQFILLTPCSESPRTIAII